MGERAYYPNSYITVVAMVFTLSACSSTGELKPFSSDGCSHFPEGTSEHKNLWYRCCLEHDKAYWIGGTYRQRQVADYSLRECVREVGKPVIATIMLGGVRVGGSPYWPTKFRWGYGWPYPRGYKALTLEERSQAVEEINFYRQNQTETEP